ncbi:MAG: septum formation initiator family protein [Mariprofundaceae bacterium]|nr:septum formation initiator family protein [Mariprofundaceae bacterium]
MFLELIQRKPWLITVLGGLIILWLAYSVFLSQHGLPTYWKEKQVLDLLKLDLQEVQAKREDLAKRILLLRHNNTYLESVIRSELGYVYPDEYILMMTVPNDKKTKESENDGP